MKKLSLKRHGVIASAVAAVAILVAAPSMAGATSMYQTLVWADEFNSGSAPSSTNWAYDLGGGGWGNNELQTYTSNLSNASVANGQLSIVARNDTVMKRKKPVSTITSARIKTLGKFNWQYGRLDVRAKLPRGVGSWPAFWMLPSGAKYGTQYLANGEIDMMEEVGADQNVIVGSAHSLAYNPSLGTTRHGVTYVADADTAFHTYSLEWTPEYLSYLIDDAEYYRVYNDHSGYQSWPYDQPYYLIINLAVGGSWGGYKGVDKTSMPWTLAIDYVRIYK